MYSERTTTTVPIVERTPLQHRSAIHKRVEDSIATHRCASNVLHLPVTYISGLHAQAIHSVCFQLLCDKYQVRIQYS